MCLVAIGYTNREHEEMKSVKTIIDRREYTNVAKYNLHFSHEEPLAGNSDIGIIYGEVADKKIARRFAQVTRRRLKAYIKNKPARALHLRSRVAKSKRIKSIKRAA